MKWWWVNHNQTAAEEVGGGYLWSPKTNGDGSRNQTYENMALVAPGDLIFSYSAQKIRAIGVAISRAAKSAKPSEFGTVGENWSKTGWLLPVEFSNLLTPISPKVHIDSIRSLLPAKYSPIQTNGNGNQKFYLMEISDALATRLLDFHGKEGHMAISASRRRMAEQEAEEEIRRDISLGRTERRQLVLARQGQGIFRARVARIEPCCRLTGTSDQGHLRASHIKPWRLSSNAERLDGYNGLLLAPHVDHLFDRGYLSFADDGQILVSQELPGSILIAWRLPTEGNAGVFRSRQRPYLDFHRQYIFRAPAASILR